jgi:hypothetical protein
MLKQENGGLTSLPNEHVVLHADIDEGEILNFTYYNSLLRPSSQVERMGGVFFGQFFGCNTFILKLLPHLPSPYEKVRGVFLWVKVYSQYLKALKGDIVSLRLVSFYVILNIGF